MCRDISRRWVRLGCVRNGDRALAQCAPWAHHPVDAKVLECKAVGAGFIDRCIEVLRNASRDHLSTVVTHADAESGSGCAFSFRTSTVKLRRDGLQCGRLIRCRWRRRRDGEGEGSNENDQRCGDPHPRKSRGSRMDRAADNRKFRARHDRLSCTLSKDCEPTPIDACQRWQQMIPAGWLPFHLISPNKPATGFPTSGSTNCWSGDLVFTT